MAGWYRQGTVALTPGSAAVTGAGTMWMGVVRPGSAFTTDGRTLYEIREVANDHTLTLDRPWEGETEAASAYAVIAASATLSNAELAGEIAAMVAKWAVREDQYDDWLGGSPNGGPNGDGKYPLTDSKGVTRLVESPARLLQLLDDGVVEHAAQIIAAIEDDVATARQAATDATAAMTAVSADRQAVAQAAATVAAQTGESTAAAATATAQAAIAVQRADEAANSAAAAAGLEASAAAALATVETARDIVLEARTEAGTAATGALSSRAAAEAARDTATAARDAALEARDAAETARTQAHDWAVKTDAPVSGSLKSALSYALDAASQATSATGKAMEAAVSAAAAAASAVALDAAASTAQAAASDAAAGAQTATSKAAAATLSADIARSAAQQAETAGAGSATARTAAEAARDSAATAVTAAQVAATQATQSQTNAANSAQTAAAAAADAISAKSDATSARDLAVAARTEAQGARDLAQAFAQGAVGYQPSPGVYSAFHWSEQAKGHAQTAATIVGGSNFGIVGDGSSQRFAADNPGSLLNLVQAPGGKLTFNPGSRAVSFGFDAATAPVAASGGITAGTVQAALEEIDHRLSTLSQDSIANGGGSVNVTEDGAVEIVPAAGRMATYKGGELHTFATAYGKAQTDAAIAAAKDGLATVARTGVYDDLLHKPDVYTRSQTEEAIAAAQLVGAARLTTPRTIALSGGVTTTATSFDGTQDITIPVSAVSAAALTGTVPLANLPAGALDRLVTVASDAERFALTTATVQLGDTVQVGTGGPMYRVVDDANLGNASGYRPYTAARASAVDWSGIENKPSTRAGFGLTDAQPLNGLLTSIASLDSSNGLLSQTSASTVTKRAIGAAAETDIPDRRAADGRYARLIANSFTGKQTVIGDGTSLPASTGIAAASSNSGAFEIQPQGIGDAAGAAFMSFHRPNNYAVHLGLDTDNKLKVGGWSMGSNAYELWHSGNAPVDGAATADTVAKRASDGSLYAARTTSANGSAIVALGSDSDPLDAYLQINGSANSSAPAGARGLAIVGNVGKIGIYSNRLSPHKILEADPVTRVVDFAQQPTINGQPIASTGSSITKSAVTVVPAGGSVNVLARTIPAVYTQFIGQTFNVDYNTEASYTQENAATGTDQVAGQFQLYNTAGAQIDAATKLLIHADGTSGSTEIIDERGITPFGTHCGWFDGSSYWRVPSSHKVNFGAGNFTYEFWMRPSGTKDSCFFSTNAIGLVWKMNGQFQFYNAGWGNIGTASYPADAWYHVALVRASGVLTVYVNGISIHSVGWAANEGPEALNIGKDGAGIYTAAGWLDQVRISKGARYTSNFAPVTTAFAPDEQTIHLLTFDDGHGGQVLKDRAGSGRVVLLGGTSGVYNEQAKFGTTSLKLGTGGSCVVGWASTPHADMAMEGDNFTVDLWFYKTNNTSACLLSLGNNTYAPQLWVDSSVRVYLSSNNTSWDIANGTALTGYTLNVWNHLALTRSGTTVYAFLNGTLIGSWSVGTAAFTMAGPYYYFGGAPDNSAIMSGYLDEVRVKRGVAEWIANFAVPTAPYAADDRTILLLHFDGANSVLDSSGSSYGTNAFGDVTTPALGFLGGVSLSAAQTRGGHATALAFSGASIQCVIQSYVNPSAGHPIYFGTNTKLCIEGWFYFASLSNAPQIFNLSAANTQTTGTMQLWVHTDGTLRLNIWNNGAVVASTAAVSTGAWNHVALVRDGLGWFTYVNGVKSGLLYGPNVNMTYVSNDTYRLIFGAHWDISQANLNGAIDAIRITNGHPRYTANFTPATLVRDDMTTLMWEFNGVVGQKWVKELSGNSAMITANGNARTVKDGRWITYAAGAKISTAWSAFGTGSVLFDGSNPGIDLGTGSEWQFSGDFTVDTRLRLNAINQYHTIAAKGGAAAASDRAWDFSVSSSNRLQFNVYVDTTIHTATGATILAANTAYHVAAVRSGNTLMVFLNGALDGSTTMSGTMNTSTVAARIGSFWTGASELSISNAYFDEMRISNTARWTSNFTPPAIAYGQQFVTGPFYVATKAETSINVSDWSTIHSATITQSTPPGTSIKWVVSFDGRVTWKYWNGSAWASLASLTSANLDANGNDYLTLQTALAGMNVESYTTIDFAFSLKTTNQNFSPTVDNITLAKTEYELGAAKIDYTIKRNGATGAEEHRITNLKAYPVNVVYDHIL